MTFFLVQSLLTFTVTDCTANQDADCAANTDGTTVCVNNVCSGKFNILVHKEYNKLLTAC